MASQAEWFECLIRVLPRQEAVARRYAAEFEKHCFPIARTRRRGASPVMNAAPFPIAAAAAAAAAASNNNPATSMREKDASTSNPALATAMSSDPSSYVTSGGGGGGPCGGFATVGQPPTASAASASASAPQPPKSLLPNQLASEEDQQAAASITVTPASPMLGLMMGGGNASAAAAVAANHRNSTSNNNHNNMIGALALLSGSASAATTPTVAAGAGGGGAGGEHDTDGQNSSADDDGFVAREYAEAFFEALTSVTDEQMREMGVVISHRGVIRRLFSDIRKVQQEEEAYEAQEHERRQEEEVYAQRAAAEAARRQSSYHNLTANALNRMGVGSGGGAGNSDDEQLLGGVGRFAQSIALDRSNLLALNNNINNNNLPQTRSSSGGTNANTNNVLPMSAGGGGGPIQIEEDQLIISRGDFASSNNHKVVGDSVFSFHTSVPPSPKRIGGSGAGAGAGGAGTAETSESERHNIIMRRKSSAVKYVGVAECNSPKTSASATAASSLRGDNNTARGDRDGLGSTVNASSSATGNRLRSVLTKLNVVGNAIGAITALHNDVHETYSAASTASTPRSAAGDGHTLKNRYAYILEPRVELQSAYSKLKWIALNGDRESQEVFMAEVMRLRQEFGFPKKFIERAFKDDGPMPFFLQQGSHAVLLMRIPSTEEDAEEGTSIRTITNRVVMLFKLAPTSTANGGPAGRVGAAGGLAGRLGSKAAAAGAASEDIVVTYHRFENDAFREMHSLWEGSLKMELNTSTVASTAKEFLQRLLMLYRDSITQLEDRSEAAEDNPKLVEVVERLSLIQKQAAVYARCLESFQDTLRSAKSYGAFESLVDELNETANGLHAKSMEVAENANTTINLKMALDSYKSGLNMKNFTYLSIVCQPIGVCTGWFGMNWFNMPELAFDNGYFIFCGAILAMVIMICVALWWSERTEAQAAEEAQARGRGEGSSQGSPSQRGGSQKDGGSKR